MVLMQLQQMQRNIDDMIKKGRMKEKYIVIFGCNEPAENLMDYLIEKGIIINAIIDNNSAIKGKICRKIRIQLPYEALGREYIENAMVFILSKYYNEMCAQLKQLGYEEDRNIIKVIEMNEGSQYDTSAAVFSNKIERVKRGAEIIKSIKMEYGEDTQIFVLPHLALGDTYIVGKYFENYIEKEGFSKYVFVFASIACTKVIHLFGIDQVIIMEKEQVDEIVQAYIFIGKQSNTRVLHNSYLYSNKIDNLSNYKKINFSDQYKYGVLGLEECNQGMTPYKTLNREYAKELFIQNNLIKGKTIILSPYANSLKKLSNDFWESLVDILKQKGYTVCTNSSNERELPIRGTKAIFFPINEAIGIVEYAGGFIGLRSGICDIIATAEALKIVMYPDKYYRCDTMQCFFGLKNMDLCQEVKEFIYDEEKETKLLSEIRQIIETTE